MILDRFRMDGTVAIVTGAGRGIGAATAVTLAEAGARIAPPVPAWYHQPSTIEEMVDFLVIRVFDALGDTLAPLRRWTGPIQP